jgi:hypothetical protein
MGSVLTTGYTRYYVVPYSTTITGWSILATGTSPTATIDIWKVSYGTSLPIVSNTILGTKPALSTGNVIRATNTTGFNSTSLTAGDVVGFNIDATTNALTLIFTLELA